MIYGMRKDRYNLPVVMPAFEQIDFAWRRY